MGFLKFLKRSKEERLEAPIEDLDVPPMPPTGLKDEFPPMPKLELIREESEEVPAESEPYYEPEENAPSFGTKLKGQEMEEQIEEPIPFGEIPKPPEMPSFEKKTKLQTPAFKKPAAPEISKKPKIFPADRLERAAVKEERKILRHETAPSRTIFVEVEKFREIRGHIRIIKEDLRNSDEALLRLQDMKEIKDKEFDKWQKAVEDLQKKMIFMDKTLFKGD